jgi:hypothetical protein
MHTTINPSCPGCQHVRCDYCIVDTFEIFKGRDIHRSKRNSNAGFEGLCHRELPKSSLKFLRRSNAKPMAYSLTPAKATSPNNSTFSPASTFYSISSEIFTPPQQFSESESDLESTDDSSEHDYDDEEDDPMTTYKNQIIRVVECRIMELLYNDLDMAASILPGVFSKVRDALEIHSQSGFNRIVPGREELEESRSSIFSESLSGGGATNDVGRSATSWSSIISATLKRQRDSDDSEDERQPSNHGIKGLQPSPDSDLWSFACPFHKLEPEKYGHGNNRKYRSCANPSIPMYQLRRLK